MNNTAKHIYTFDQLQSFVDGTLDKAIAGQLEQHLAACAECRVAVAKLRSLETKTAQALPADAPDKYFDTFGSRVSSRIAARAEASRSRVVRFAWWGLVPAAAAAVLALLVTLNPEHSLRQQALVRGQIQQASKTMPRIEAPAKPDRGSTANAPAQPEKQVAPAAPAPSAERSTELSAPQPAALEEDDKLALRKERQALPAAGIAIATKDEAAVPALRAAPGTSFRAAPTVTPSTAVATGGLAEAKSKSTAEPAPVAAVAGLASKGKQPNEPASPLPGPEPSCAPLAINQLQVIVIHLPDGNTACPAPAIGTAIEIVIPADCRPAN